jgi:hypothetical protein
VPTTKTQAVAVVRRQANLTEEEAQKLVDAVAAGAVDEAFETIAGSGPVPTTMPDARAARLRFVTERLGRHLRGREVEVVFRVTRNTARSIVARMAATYPEVLPADRLQQAVRGGAHPRPAGKEAGRRRYVVQFDDETSFNAAEALLNQRGLTQDVRRDDAALTLDLPQRMGATRVNPLDVLGIKDLLP